ncbi:hypothetical protein [Streptomyces sp. NPDC048606]|uniref:hypothetical protein n=1 Tax=Streptomyces sp. NPDC048606 TaxID=3154726 RepID=UPI003426EF29
MRTSVHTYDDDEYNPREQGVYVGHFEMDSATAYQEARDITGASVHPVPKYAHQTLYYTSGGRWVLRTSSQREGSQLRTEYIDAADAKAWLRRNQDDDVIEERFGQEPEEVGPRLGGRPAIGPKWEVRLDAEVRRRVAEYGQGRPRADVLRDLIVAGLAASTQA